MLDEFEFELLDELELELLDEFELELLDEFEELFPATMIGFSDELEEKVSIGGCWPAAGCS